MLFERGAERREARRVEDQRRRRTTDVELTHELELFQPRADLRMARIGFDILGLIPAGVNRFVWILDFPLFQRSPATGELWSVNHPFTAPNPEDLPLLETAPERVRALAYDMVLNGTELGGGAEATDLLERQKLCF